MDVFNEDGSYSRVNAYGILTENKSGFYDEVNLIDVATKKEISALTLNSGATLIDDAGNEIGKEFSIVNSNSRNSNDPNDRLSSEVDFYKISHTYAAKQTQMRIRIKGADLTVSCTNDQKVLKDF